MRRICIFFDIDDTLLDDRRAVTIAAQAFYKEHTALFTFSSDDFVEAWKRASKKHIQRFLTGECSFQDQRRARLQELCRNQHMSATDIDKLFESYRQHYENNVCPFEDVMPCLSALSDYPMGIISNGDSAQQRRKLQAAGLYGHFQTVIISGDIGIHKPDTEIFHEACRQTNYASYDCIYVGDMLETDSKASSSAGMFGVWLNRTGKPPVSPRVVMIRSLEELPGIVRNQIFKAI